MYYLFEYAGIIQVYQDHSLSVSQRRMTKYSSTLLYWKWNGTFLYEMVNPG